ncbi:MAG: nitroreductase [Gemmatimonadetes bacterium]|nr:nitroreductase [Gemmatimonadota bacterium]
MDILHAIATRRSIGQFLDRAVPPEALRQLLEAALQAPNHRMTQPVRFRVLGPAARHGYGAALGARKAKKLADPAAARAVIDKTSAAEVAVPAAIAVSVVLDPNPEIREEDYATALMGVQNLMLAAVALGLGTRLRTGAIMDDPHARAALEVPDGERIVGIVQVGHPASTPDAKPRRSVDEVTRWLA